MKKPIILFLMTILCFQLNAQWNEDTDVNTLVVDAEGGDMQAIGTSDGKTFVVFWKSVPAPQNYELRVQLLDSDGSQLFGNDGMLVSDAISMSTFTVIWSITIDDEDNLYIGATGTQNFDAYAFKMDTSGNSLWGDNGIQLGTGNVVKILPLSNGDAIATWYPAPQSLMQRIDANGDFVWDTPMTVENDGAQTVPGELFEISDGGYILVFHQLLAGINSLLYAQRYDADGVAQWSNPTQLANRTTVFNRNYSKAQDGDVVYMGYFASIGNRFDSFLQRIETDGSLPWGINGTDFDVNETNYETETSIAFAPGSDFVWAVCTYTDISQNQRGEYIQKFDKLTGERLFTNNAKELYEISSNPNVHAGQLQLLDDQPYFLIKSGLDTGASPTTLHLAHLDESGEFISEEGLQPIATFAANKSRVQFTRPAGGQSVAVFIEQKASDDFPRIYAQNTAEFELSNPDLESAFSLYYNNPVKEFLNIQSIEPVVSIIVFDALGRKVFESKYAGETQIQIPASSWKKGMYLMTVQTVVSTFKGIKLIK
jgi:hypothetical protein